MRQTYLKNEVRFNDTDKVIPEHLKNYQFVTGEKHKYLGHYYCLIIKEIANEDDEHAELQKNHLVIYTTRPNNVRWNALILDTFYKEKAEEIFTPILAAAVVNALPYNKKKLPKLHIYRMSNEWGACNPKTGALILNLELIKTPVKCIEFVAQHEVLHLSFPSHNNAFFAALKTLMPDWREREKILREKYAL